MPPPAGGTIVKPRASAGPDSNPVESFALQSARNAFPVKLYSAPGCEPCVAARGLLHKRGVPFSEVIIDGDSQQIQELEKASGARGVPALLVGRAVQSGFEEGAYHRLLDEAGYPKTGVLPPRSERAPAVENKPYAPRGR